MTWSHDHAADLLAAARPVRAVAKAGPLPAGVGLAIGAVTSLGLWAGLAQIAVRLLG